jgi:hypothetical protein
LGPALVGGVAKAARVEEVVVVLDVNACNAAEEMGGEQDKLPFVLALISLIIYKLFEFVFLLFFMTISFFR